MDPKIFLRRKLGTGGTDSNTPRQYSPFFVFGLVLVVLGFGGSGGYWWFLLFGFRLRRCLFFVVCGPRGASATRHTRVWDRGTSSSAPLDALGSSLSFWNAMSPLLLPRAQAILVASGGEGPTFSGFATAAADYRCGQLLLCVPC